MLESGLLDEVRALRARGDLHAGLPSMRCVGYRQAWETLDAAAEPDRAALQVLQERGAAATRQLAKRQLTWLRGMPWRHVVASDAADATGQVVALAARLLEGRR
jgi:tRNA dimethylallyltransferase